MHRFGVGSTAHARSHSYFWHSPPSRAKGARLRLGTPPSSPSRGLGRKLEKQRWSLRLQHRSRRRSAQDSSTPRPSTAVLGGVHFHNPAQDNVLDGPLNRRKHP